MARRNKSSLVTEVFKDNTTKQYVIKRIGNIVRKELFTMCSEKTGSILSSKHVSDLKEFTWDKLLTELDSHEHTQNNHFFILFISGYFLYSSAARYKKYEEMVIPICINFHWMAVVNKYQQE